jgi:hypothetical protein
MDLSQIGESLIGKKVEGTVDGVKVRGTVTRVSEDEYGSTVLIQTDKPTRFFEADDDYETGGGYKSYNKIALTKGEMRNFQLVSDSNKKHNTMRRIRDNQGLPDEWFMGCKPLNEPDAENDTLWKFVLWSGSGYGLDRVLCYAPREWSEVTLESLVAALDKNGDNTYFVEDYFFDNPNIEEEMKSVDYKEFDDVYDYIDWCGDYYVDATAQGGGVHVLRGENFDGEPTDKPAEFYEESDEDEVADSRRVKDSNVSDDIRNECVSMIQECKDRTLEMLSYTDFYYGYDGDDITTFVDGGENGDDFSVSIPFETADGSAFEIFFYVYNINRVLNENAPIEVNVKFFDEYNQNMFDYLSATQGAPWGYVKDHTVEGCLAKVSSAIDDLTIEEYPDDQIGDSARRVKDDRFDDVTGEIQKGIDAYADVFYPYDQSNPENGEFFRNNRDRFKKHFSGRGVSVSERELSGRNGLYFERMKDSARRVKDSEDNEEVAEVVVSVIGGESMSNAEGRKYANEIKNAIEYKQFSQGGEWCESQDFEWMDRVGEGESVAVWGIVYGSSWNTIKSSVEEWVESLGFDVDVELYDYVE